MASLRGIIEGDVQGIKLDKVENYVCKGRMEFRIYHCSYKRNDYNGLAMSSEWTEWGC
jgi:hypothetical protein